MRTDPTTSPAGPATAVQPPWRLVRGFLLDLLIAVAVFVTVVIACGVAIGVVGAVSSRGQDMEEFTNTPLAQSLFLAAMALGTVLAAMVPYLWRRRAGRDEIAAANAALKRGSTWGWIAVVAVALQAGSYLLSWLDERQGWGLEPSNVQPIMELMAAYPAVTWIYVVVLAPVFEELLFRRVLFGRFLAGGRPLLGYLLTGALFASFHEFAGLSQGGWLQTALLWSFYFAMAVGLAWVYRRTGSLWAPILVHMANNAFAMWWLAAM